MLDVRPLVVADGIVVGGNMRLRALQELKVEEVPVIDVTEWTQAQRDEFMIKDNLTFGDWDYDILANEWEGTNLEDWGLDLWQEEKPQEEQKQRGIKIVFKNDDYDTANELINALKNADTYIGGIVLDALRLQFK